MIPPNIFQTEYAYDEVFLYDGDLHNCTSKDGAEPWEILEGSLFYGLTYVTTTPRLTIAFTSDGSITKDGFEMQVGLFSGEDAGLDAGAGGQGGKQVIFDNSGSYVQ